MQLRKRKLENEAVNPKPAKLRKRSTISQAEHRRKTARLMASPDVQPDTLRLEQSQIIVAQQKTPSPTETGNM